MSYLYSPAYLPHELDLHPDVARVRATIEAAVDREADGFEIEREEWEKEQASERKCWGEEAETIRRDALVEAEEKIKEITEEAEAKAMEKMAERIWTAERDAEIAKDRQADADNRAMALLAYLLAAFYVPRDPVKRRAA